MRKFALFLSVVGLVLGLAVQAGAAGKPAYKVSLRTSVATSTADHFLVVSGKVTGPRAAGRNVTIQRRYEGGPWVSVASATISRSGRYSARVETPRGGTTSFRALKGRSSARKAGTSPARSIPVYRWISLASSASLDEQPVQPGVQETIGGRSYPAIGVYQSTDAYFKLGDRCTKFSTIVEYSGPAAEDVDLTFAKQPTGGGSATVTAVNVPTGAPLTVQTTLVGARALGVFVDNLDSGYKLVLADPRAYCNADELPLWTLAELK